MSAEVLALKARQYHELKSSLIGVEADCVRLDGAVELMRVQQEEAQDELATLKKCLAEEEDTARVFAHKVPSYVLAEDVPNYMSKRSELLATIFALHNAILNTELRAREHEFALFGGEEEAARSFEASQVFELARKETLKKTKERLMSQIDSEAKRIKQVSEDKSKMDAKLRQVHDKLSVSRIELDSKRRELERAREAARDSLAMVNARRAEVAKARKRLAREEAKAAEQEALLEGLRAENSRLEEMSSSRHLSDNSIDRAPSLTCTQKCTPKMPSRAKRLHISDVNMGSQAVVCASDSLRDHFRSVNGRLLQNVSETVRELEVAYSESKKRPTYAKKADLK